MHKKGKNRRLNAQGICYFECAPSDNGGNRGNKRDQNEVANDSRGTNCGECRNLIQKDTPSMQCEACFSWFHLKPCCNIDAAKYKALENNDLLDVIRWFCNKCDQGIIQLASEIVDIKERLAALERKTNVKAMVKEAVQDHFKEEAEKEKRKLNVIVHGLPEPDQETEDENSEARVTTGQERKEADRAKVISIGTAHPHIGIVADDIEGVFRLGAARNDGKPRPVCLKLRTSETRRRLLQHGRVLRSSDTEWHKQVFINPDLTPAQREKDRAVRKELNKRQQNG